MYQSRLIKWIFPAALALSPLLLLDSLLDPELAIRFLYLGILGVAMLAIVRKADGQGFSQTISMLVHWRDPQLMGILAWLVATIFSVTAALQKSEWLLETVRVLFVLVTYLWVLIWVRTNHKNIVSLSIGFCCLGFILSAIGITELVESLRNVSADSGYYPVDGRMGNRNLLAIMLSLCLPFHFMVFERYSALPVRIGLAANFSFSVATVFLTGSRVGWLGLVVMFIVCGIALMAVAIRRRMEKKQLAKAFAGFAMMILIMVSAAFILLKNPATSTQVAARLKSFYNFKTEENIHTTSIRERLELWSSSIQLIKKHPVTGVGAGNWKFRYPETSLSGRSAQGDVLFQQPHNDFLWVFSETGALGGLAFGLLFVIAIFYATRLLLKKEAKGEKILLSTAVLAGVSMYAVHSFFDFPKERPLTLFAFACYLALASSLQTPQAESAGSEKRSQIFYFLFLGVVVVNGLFLIGRMQAEMQLKKAMRARGERNYKKVKTQLENVNSLFLQSDMNGTPVAWYKGEAEYRLGNLDASQKDFEEALRLSPYHLYSHYNLGSIHYYRKDIPAAIGEWQAALSIAPHFVDAAINLSSAYYNQRKYEKAASALSKAEVNYTNHAHASVVAAVMSAYAEELKAGIQSPELLAAIDSLRSSPMLLQDVQIRMRLYDRSAKQVMINRAIAIAQKKQRLTTAELDSLWEHYRLK